ncbi:MAG: hypothetical protein EOM30_10045 [Clostridia bacterium]|jgi:V/A-type H+/Na+-transporting ATPase subunit K|nr:hypothetical protein [Clostridia bacterium]NLS86158.1 hypothetical protein [Oscillospiraceae bacterium]
MPTSPRNPVYHTSTHKFKYTIHLRGVFTMKKINSKKLARIFIAMIVISVLAFAFASFSFAEGEAAPAAASDGGLGLGLIAAALSTGIAGIGAGIAVGAGAPAAIGALTEDAKTFGKALIFVVLGEGIALYGMLISILILNKI